MARLSSLNRRLDGVEHTMNSIPVLSALRHHALSLVLLALVVPLKAAPLMAEADVLAFTDRFCSACHNDVDT
jgi:hypothetical protein